MIVDNQSVEGDACQFLSDLASLGLEQVRILRYDEPFNFAEMGNAAAQQAREMFSFSLIMIVKSLMARGWKRYWNTHYAQRWAW